MAHPVAGRRSGRRHRASAPKAAQAVPLVLDADRYGGQWIATLKGHVVAFGPSLIEVNRSLDASGFGSDVILTRVPRTGDVVL